MFTAPRDSSPRQRSASRSTDDYSSTKDRPRTFFQRYVHDLSLSSHSLATTSSHHDDLPIPSMPAHTSHTTSAQSTPMTSPSTGYSSLFPGSLSSATSESVPNAESKHQSDFGLLTPASASSTSSHPISPRSRSITESDSQASAPRMPRRYPSGHFSHRLSTAPQSPPASPTATGADSSPIDHHTRSHSRLTVRIKNLLSKSAIPSPSRFSFNSAATAPSDSEASSRSFHVLASAGKWPMTPRKSRPPDLEISARVSPAMPRPGHTSNPPTDAHRRYASEAVAKIYNSGTGSGPPTSQESLDVPIRNVPLLLARGREPKTRNVLRRRPSGSAKLFKGRERSMTTPSCSREGDADRLRLPPKEGMTRQGGIPFPLTAAGAVVEAYKQQKLHCDDTSPPKLSIEDRMSSSASHDGRDHLEHSPTPYYTAFGSESGRGMQAGGPDDRWNKFEADQSIWAMSQTTSSHQASVSRSITRKVSNRWRQLRGGGVTSEESPSRGRGRPSLQEMWGVDRSSARSTGRSIDGVPNAGDGAWASPVEGHARSGSEKGDGGEGGKLWRLMRRISTGGLRDRFQFDKVVPPVPAIPKELLEKVNQGERSNEPLSPSRHLPSSYLRDKDLIRTFTAPKNIAVVRPSVATVSSSPISSDVASPQSFHKTHSVRSSVSSYGEAVVPPLRDGVLDRRIITPLEQLRLADDDVENGEPGTSSVPVPRSSRRSMSVPAGLRTVEDAEGGCVPLPSPRRLTCSGESPSSVSSRPCSTSVSASGSACASYQGRGLGLGGSRREDGIVSLSPPPRPPNKSRRGGSVASLSSQSMVVKQVDGGVGIGGVRQMDRVPSAQSDMTARVDSPEPGRSRGQGQGGDQSPSSHTSTLLTFRELDAPRRPPLSEREKADVWNDLLARSDMAGGTLHINGAEELLSDSMRFSAHSEI